MPQAPMTAYRPRALSVSAVQLYMTCPAQYEARYVKRLVTPSDPRMLFGSVFHRALEAEHRGEDSERTLIAEWNVAQANLDAAGLGEMPSKAHALALLDAYKVAGYGGQLGIPEHKVTLPFPSKEIPVPLTGYVDLLLPERRRFREYKTTSGTSWTQEKVQAEHQLHVYGWFYQRLFNHRAERAEYMIFSTVQPSLNVIEAVPSPDGFRLFEIAAAAVWRGIVGQNYVGCGTCNLCKPPTEKPPKGPTCDWEEWS